MRSYLSLVPISARAHRRENRLTVACIAIAVFLVTAVFSMTDVMVREEISRLTEKHGAEEVQSFFSLSAVQSLYPVAAVLFVLVLLAGILMIGSSMNSSVARRTTLFGVLRCMGMTRRQIRRSVRLEALCLCRSAIPIGFAAGTLAQWALCAVLRYWIAGEFSDMPQLTVSFVGILFGALVGLTTVLIAAGKPGRMAAKCSPVEAVSGVSRGQVSRPAARRLRLSVPAALGIDHAAGSKRNLFLISGSFALSIVLFLTFSVFMELIGCMMPQYSAEADVEIRGDAETCSLSPELLPALEAIPGVERVFARASAFDLPAGGQGISAVDVLISYSDYELSTLQKDKVLKPGADISSVLTETSALIITDSDIQAGDTLTVCGVPVSVSGSLRYDLFSEDGLCHGETTLIVSHTTFARLTGSAGYSLINLTLSSEADESVLSAISTASVGAEAVEDLREYDTRSTYLAFSACVYTFLGLIALVSVLNVLSGVSIRITSSLREYGSLRAVGMSERQLESMIRWECGTYTVVGGVLGLCFGLLLSRWLYGVLVTSHYPFAHWQFPLLRIVAICLYLALASCAAVRLPLRRLRGKEITALLRSI